MAPDASIATWLVEDPLTDPQPDVNRAVALASVLEETLPAFLTGLPPTDSPKTQLWTDDTKWTDTGMEELLAELVA